MADKLKPVSRHKKMEEKVNIQVAIGDNWDINLTSNLSLALIVDSGASDIDIDMSMAMLRQLRGPS